MTTKGIKISELSEKYNVTGNEYIPLSEGTTNSKIKTGLFEKKLISGANIKTINGESILGSGDIEIRGGMTDLNAVEVEVSNTVGIPSGEGNIQNNTLYLSFENLKGEKGDPGQKGDPGEPGIPGVNGIVGRTIFAFKSSIEKPNRPVGGSWDINTNEVILPDGWQPNASGLDNPVWMSTCVFNSVGKPDGYWSDPIKITGDNGSAGADGYNLQFIYKLSKNELEKPDKPQESPRDDYYPPTGWTNHPSGVSKSSMSEWMCVSRKNIETGVWEPWEGPTLWANYGISGTDGDGVKYAFKVTDSSLPPEQPAGNGELVEAPEGWTDEPNGVDIINQWEWVTTSKYNGTDKIWSNWSKPSLWAKYGANGESGVSGRTAFIFKSGLEKPEKPTGGSWNPDSNIVTPPDGWNNDASDLESPIWMSTGVFNASGGMISSWSDPIKITGENGLNGTDGGNTQFIYKLTVNDKNKPTKPIFPPRDDFSSTDGWENHALGISEEYRAEWICMATKKSASDGWSEWSEPSLWSNWGMNGMDGDGTKYAFKNTNTGSNPGQPNGTGETSEYPTDEENPDNTGWTDEPCGVDIISQWEWVTISKYSGSTKTWSQWSMPSLWAKYGENGKNGDRLEVQYALTDGTDEVPALVTNNRNPGSEWRTTMPIRTENTQAIWGTQALINADNELVGEWSSAYLITGINGVDAVPMNYHTYVYKLSENKPEKPSSNDPNNPGDGWLDYPNTTGQWWQCIGLVNGRSELVESWGEVLPVNGKDGIAQDGKFIEFRFAKSSSNVAPNINKSLRSPSGWTTSYPVLSSGEILWMTKATINPNDTLYTQWDTPVRISGEQGPQGNQGPVGPAGSVGPQGVSGIPGKFIEVRYCLGTDVSYDGTSSPGSNRNPSGWYTTLPSTTVSKPYIWFIQATIEYSDNEDSVGNIATSWSKPSMLTGKNGLNGSNGTSIIWKGEFKQHPSNPENGWAYKNTTDKKSYIYQDGSWYQMTIDGVDGKNGSDGQNGLSIVWKGDLSTAPLYPKENWVYRDTDNGKVYIYNGTSWELMVVDGNDGIDGANGQDGYSVYITYNDSNSTPSRPTGNGTSNGWHTNATADSKWMSQKVAADSSSGSWGSPIKIKGENGADGVNGEDGAPGRNGQIIYPQGIYEVNKTYTVTETNAPYVYDPNAGKFYVLNLSPGESWTGTSQGNRNPSQAYPNWVELTNYDAIFAKVGIIANGLIGSAVFNGDWMFSQYGINYNGVQNSNYEEFNPSWITLTKLSSSVTFIPKYAVNLKTGVAYMHGDGTSDNIPSLTIDNGQITFCKKSYSTITNYTTKIINGNTVYHGDGDVIITTQTEDISNIHVYGICIGTNPSCLVKYNNNDEFYKLSIHNGILKVSDSGNLITSDDNTALICINGYMWKFGYPETVSNFNTWLNSIK